MMKFCNSKQFLIAHRCHLRWSMPWLGFPSMHADTARPLRTSAIPAAEWIQSAGDKRSDLFSQSSQSAAYKEFRPIYPEHMFDKIVAFAKPGDASGSFKDDGTCIDIATGSGQAVVPLAARFARILALDTSVSQINEAKTLALHNVHFMVGDAHATQLPPGAADLVTVGQALHWMELHEFYTEVRRLLKPSGAFAAWTYDHGEYQDTNGVPMTAVNSVMHEMFSKKLGPYWDSRRKLVDDRYPGMDPSAGEFKTVCRHTFTMTRPMTVDAVVGMVQSWSAYGTYIRQHPERVDPLIELKTDLCAAVQAQNLPKGNADSGQPCFQVMHTITLLLAKQPVPVSSTR